MHFERLQWYATEMNRKPSPTDVSDDEWVTDNVVVGGVPTTSSHQRSAVLTYLFTWGYGFGALASTLALLMGETYQVWWLPLQTTIVVSGANALGLWVYSVGVRMTLDQRAGSRAHGTPYPTWWLKGLGWILPLLGYLLGLLLLLYPFLMSWNQFIDHILSHGWVSILWIPAFSFCGNMMEKRTVNKAAAIRSAHTVLLQ